MWCTRFKNEFLEAQKKLTLEGKIVISVGLFGHSGDVEVWSKGTKKTLDDIRTQQENAIKNGYRQDYPKKAISDGQNRSLFVFAANSRFPGWLEN